MKVSVIIPVYNVEKYITRCLSSVVNQSHRDLEIIVVNDATIDGSMKIVEKFASQDNRFVIVSHPHNSGLMMTRRSGYTIAKGDYLMFVDSDDEIPYNAIEVMVSKMGKGEFDIVVGSSRSIYIDGKSKKLSSKLPYGDDSLGVYRALLEKKMFHSLWGKMYNTNLFKNKDYITYDNLTFGEDAILFYQIVKHVKKVAIIDNVVYDYYLSIGTSTIQRLTIKQFECSLKADQMINECCKNISSLSLSLNHYLTYDVTRFFYILDRSRDEIVKLISDYGLINLCSFVHCVKTLTIKEQLQWCKAYMMMFFLKRKN